MHPIDEMGRSYLQLMDVFRDYWHGRRTIGYKRRTAVRGNEPVYEYEYPDYYEDAGEAREYHHQVPALHEESRDNQESPESAQSLELNDIDSVAPSKLIKK